MLAWSVAAKLALEFVAGGRLVPTLRPGGPGSAIAQWRIASLEDSRFTALTAALPPAAHALRRDEDDSTVWSAHDLMVAFFDAVADTCARNPTSGRGSAKPRRSDWRQEWVAALTGADPVVSAPADARIDELGRWAAPLVDAGGGGEARLCVRLAVPLPQTTCSPCGRWNTT
ncbi:hypothetical protein [Virgisporangium ochraceum]|uniref:hypothetical protein n=1 Tax=Virgisporangium ochraceum TaxID=65505 RepID=UPI001941F7F3|nr:hypothetical protein [Virgisporangium ochraceum]